MSQSLVFLEVATLFYCRLVTGKWKGVLFLCNGTDGVAIVIIVQTGGCYTYATVRVEMEVTFVS